MLKSYNYQNLKDDINKLKKKYLFLDVGSIGKSVLGRKIPYIKIGNGPKEVFYSGAFHANEWITTPILVKFAEEYLEAYKKGKSLLGYSISEIYEKVSLYIVPMINPDGVELVTGNVKNVDNYYKNIVKIAKDFPEIPFPDGWKANIEGVDLKKYQPICKVL